MTRIKLFGAAAVFAVLMASPASAEDPLAASEPGMWAFYHPNGDMGNGPARPVANANAHGAAAGHEPPDRDAARQSPQVTSVPGSKQARAPRLRPASFHSGAIAPVENPNIARERRGSSC